MDIETYQDLQNAISEILYSAVDDIMLIIDEYMDEKE